MTQEDVDDIENRLPFVLTSDEIPEYDILYAGQQQEDELHCYVFDIAPKRIEGKKRYFQGRIWVDDHDFQIVKTYGKTVPDIRKKKSNENLFPKFTTWREQIDGKYWFPTYTKADDTLHFSNQDVHIREIVKYTNYQRFRSTNRPCASAGARFCAGPSPFWLSLVPSHLARTGNSIHLNPKTSLQTRSFSASPPKKKSGSNCVSSTPSGSRCNSRRWMATRWLGNTARLQISATSRANV